MLPTLKHIGLLKEKQQATNEFEIFVTELRKMITLHINILPEPSAPITPPTPAPTPNTTAAPEPVPTPVPAPVPEPTQTQVS